MKVRKCESGEAGKRGSDILIPQFHISTIFIPPAEMLARGVARRIAARTAGILAIVPTGRSGVKLRQECERLGVAAPRCKEPFEVVAGAAVFTPQAVLRAAFISFLASCDAAAEWPHLFKEKRLPPDEAISFYGQLEDIWRSLAGGGLSMQDVPRLAAAPGPVADTFAKALGDESTRWEELASLEKLFFRHLEKSGLSHTAAVVRNVRLGVATPPLPEGVEEVVLPALVDPVDTLFAVLEKWQSAKPALKITLYIHAAESEADLFDGYGRPRLDMWRGPVLPGGERLGDDAIFLKNSCGEAAGALAASWHSGRGEAAIALADADMYGELEAAFLDAGYVLHNPQMFRLAASSLGAMALNILAIRASEEIPFKPFAALMRSDDILEAVSRATGKSPDDILPEMERYNNDAIPETLDLNHAYLHKTVFDNFRAAAETLAGWLTFSPDTGYPAFARGFFGRLQNDEAAAPEYLAAKAALDEALDALDHSAVRELPQGAFVQLARETLAAATYSLEPGPDDVSTSGWLELAWSDSPRVLVAGLHEGKTPESLIGHPFLPDSLRSALGISDNARRFARDAFLLRELLTCRERGNVEVYLSRVSNSGDMLKPSRLLFLVDDGMLVERARKLFASPQSNAAANPVREMKDGMRLLLSRQAYLTNPSKDGSSSVSPSSIDTYLRCPFTWFLRYGEQLDRRDLRVRLEKNDFGTLAHAALEIFTKNEIEWADAHNNIAHTNENEIRELIAAAVDAATERYSVSSRAVKMQLESVKARLLAVAPIQAHWAREGWRPYAAELQLRDHKRKSGGKVFLFGKDMPYLNGSIDRVDFHPVHGFRVIDYKTWDSAAGEAIFDHIAAGGAQEEAFAATFCYPLFKRTARARNMRRFLTVQVPLYALALALRNPEIFAGKVNDACYLVIGKNAENTRIWGSRHETPFDADSPMVLMDFADTALETARAAVSAMKAGVYWPPSPQDAWKSPYSGFASLFMFSPEADLPRDWIAEQEERLRVLQHLKGV